MEQKDEQLLDNERVFIYSKLAEAMKFARMEADERGLTELDEPLQIWVVKQLENQGIIKIQLVEKVVYVPQPHKMSAEEREYYRERYKRKLQEQRLSEQQQKEELKISNALKRKIAWCFNCKKNVSIINASARVKQKQNRKNRTILIDSLCNQCGAKLCSWGGNLPVQEMGRSLS